MNSRVKHLFTIILLFSFFNHFAQQKDTAREKIKITGVIIEKNSKQPLEYTTISFFNPKNPKAIAGGITNPKGEFDIEIYPGMYNIKIEFISFKSIEIKQRLLQKSTNLGTIALEEDAAQLKEVVVKAEKSSVEIKLDKKVYNVGQDMTVRGGNASDVLNNVPSVTVDTDGSVSLRGNENVRILIDGRPSNTSNISDALRTISADALEKVEVITNPSARYDAEGGAGIINIVLKKGKTNGLNGTFIATVGDPKNYGLTSNVNYKSKHFNLFSTLGYNDTNYPGNSLIFTDYLNTDGTVNKTINEESKRDRFRSGINYNFGFDWFLTNSLTWTNAIKHRKFDGTNPENVNLFNFEDNNFYIRNRFNNQNSIDDDIQYSTNFTKKFEKEGHKLTVDFSTAVNIDIDNSIITDFVIGDEANTTQEYTTSYRTEKINLVQTDYVLPFNEHGQFEAGYKGEFKNLYTDFNIGSIDSNQNFISNPNYSNILEYKEYINALYTQFGYKINKLSYLFGVRYEDSNIQINLLTNNDFNTKKYHNFFPSAFLTYQLTDETSFSLNYSKRISRPSSRYINPFANYSSNVNIFQGNPDLNPSFTDVYEISYMTKIGRINLNSSAYFNHSTSVFQFIRRPNGEVVTTEVNGQTVETPVILTTPINLAQENRFGFEFNLNYSPFKWWRLNNNFNLFKTMITGDYTYIDVNNNEITQNFDRNTLGWFSRLSSKVTLPYKIDWQTTAFYSGPRNTAQGRTLEMFIGNLAFSKDVLKEKATISLNVRDLFNSGKRRFETFIPEKISSYSELQFSQRQISISFTYRFNKKKNETDKRSRQQNNDNGDGDFLG